MKNKRTLFNELIKDDRYKHKVVPTKKHRDNRKTEKQRVKQEISNLD